MSYQHHEDGTLSLDREAAEELSRLMWEAALELRDATNPAYTGSLVERLEISAAAIMPFPDRRPDGPLSETRTSC